MKRLDRSLPVAALFDLWLSERFARPCWIFLAKFAELGFRATAWVLIPPSGVRGGGGLLSRLHPG